MSRARKEKRWSRRLAVSQSRIYHLPPLINAQIGLLIANHVREFCYSFDYFGKYLSNLPTILLFEAYTSWICCD